DYRELRIRLRTARNDLDKAEIIYAVKYDWLKDRKIKQMQKSYSDALYDYYTVSLDVPDSRIGYIFLLQSGEEQYYYSEEGLTVDYNHEKSYYNFFQYPYINEIEFIKVKWCEQQFLSDIR
ncbi:MAG: alpha amylase N-terminal ig-like domain-containing protein, partial [Coprobacter sp.]